MVGRLSVQGGAGRALVGRTAQVGGSVGGGPGAGSLHVRQRRSEAPRPQAARLPGDGGSGCAVGAAPLPQAARLPGAGGPTVSGACRSMSCVVRERACRSGVEVGGQVPSGALACCGPPSPLRLIYPVKRDLIVSSPPLSPLEPGSLGQDPGSPLVVPRRGARDSPSLCPECEPAVVSPPREHEEDPFLAPCGSRADPEAHEDPLPGCVPSLAIPPSPSQGGGSLVEEPQQVEGPERVSRPPVPGGPGQTHATSVSEVVRGSGSVPPRQLGGSGVHSRAPARGATVGTARGPISGSWVRVLLLLSLAITVAIPLSDPPRPRGGGRRIERGHPQWGPRGSGGSTPSPGFVGRAGGGPVVTLRVTRRGWRRQASFSMCSVGHRLGGLVVGTEGGIGLLCGGPLRSGAAATAWPLPDPRTLTVRLTWPHAA